MQRVNTNSGGAAATYTYDGGGLKVKRVSGSTTTVDIYSGSKLVAQYLNGVLSYEYIYAGSQMLAVILNQYGNVPIYFHQDHLSARLNTDASGALVRQFGHFLFGEVWYQTSNSPWKFTSYERDDAAGNVWTNVITYDAEGRMTNTDAFVAYHYDGDGNRVKKDHQTGSTYDKLYWHGAAGEVLVETDFSGNNPTEYVFFNGSRVARRDPDGTVYYFFSDHLGSSRMVTNSGGAVVEDSDFYPFGTERVVLDTLSNNYKFTGQEFDPEITQYYFIARHYDAYRGRFFQVDPVALSRQKMKDPQQLNMYSYARNNPIRFVDPNGETVSLSSLNQYERRKLIEELESQTGLDLDYNADTGDLYIVDQGQGGSQTYRADLTQAIDSNEVFNVVSATQGPDGQPVVFGGFDSKTNTVYIDFKDFSTSRPGVSLGLVFYHETIAHGLKGLKDSAAQDLWDIVSGRPLAWQETLKVSQELGLRPEIRGDGRQPEDDRYYIRVYYPRNDSWERWHLRSVPSQRIDITDAVKNK